MKIKFQNKTYKDLRRNLKKIQAKFTKISFFVLGTPNWSATENKKKLKFIFN